MHQGGVTSEGAIVSPVRMMKVPVDFLFATLRAAAAARPRRGGARACTARSTPPGPPAAPRARYTWHIPLPGNRLPHISIPSAARGLPLLRGLSAMAGADWIESPPADEVLLRRCCSGHGLGIGAEHFTHSGSIASPFRGT